MSKKSDIYRCILREYEKIRNTNENILREKQNYIYKKLPRISDIERELNLTGIKIAKLTIQKPVDYIERSEQLKKHIHSLREEKSKILLENNISEKFFELSYNCDKCNDTGFINNKECTCFKQKLIHKAYEQSNLSTVLEKENFDYFNIKYYSTKKCEEKGISPRKNIETILSTCLSFVKCFNSEFENLLLYGGTGLGKTFLCNSIAKDILDSGNTVLYFTASQLFKIIEKDKFNTLDDNDNIPSDYMEDIISVDLFIIDDLGTEFLTLLSSSELFNIINTRFLNKKSVIISTNLSIKDIANQYSDRIASRILGNYNALEFFGDDIRIVKKFNNF